MIHPDMANVKKDDIKTQLVKKFNTKEDRITVYGLKTRFGGGRSSGFALIYNSKSLSLPLIKHSMHNSATFVFKRTIL